MHFFFKTDANENIGSGHLQRCLNLAKILQKKHKVTFLFCNTSDNIATAVKKEFKVFFFKNNKDILEKLKYFKTKKDSNFLIIDDYSIDYIWEKSISEFCCKVLVIDDYVNKPHYCDFYLNQNIINIYDKQKLLKFFPPSTKCLLGPKYTLLNEQYCKYARLKKTKILKNITVSFGGSDRENLTEKVLGVLSNKKFAKLKIFAVLGKNYKFSKELKKKYLLYKNIVFTENLNSLAIINYNSDLAIGSGGISAWERICLSIPTITYLVSNNQKIIIDALSKRNLIIYAGKEKNFNQNNLKNLIKFAIKNYKTILNNLEYGKVLVDGIGAKRVSQIIAPDSIPIFKIKKAQKQDMFTYYNWVNDEEVKKNSFRKKSISFSNHKNWFIDQLKFPKKNYLYVFFSSDIPIGQVRFNILKTYVSIDYSIDKDFRGRGLGLKMLKKIIGKRNFSKKILAVVKLTNKPSISIFHKLGFKYLYKENKVFFYK
jgi:UDP-2,4-diacetamido-2,4,6-trideoxy-beta-L-altropyranose hydrolase